MITVTPQAERWIAPPDFPGIEVSNTGTVREVSTGRLLPIHGSGGKARVTLVNFRGESSERNVRRMVMNLFGYKPIRIEEEAPTPEVDTSVSWKYIERPDIKSGYQISTLGEVLTPRGLVLRGSRQRSKNGDYDFRLVQLPRRPGASDLIGHARLKVADLVADHFLPAPPNGDHYIRHINGDVDDCRAVNLEWAEGIRPLQKRSIARAKGNQKRANTMGKNMEKVFAGDPHWARVVSLKVTPKRYWVSRDARVMGIYGHEVKISTYSSGHLCAHVQSALTGGTTTTRLDEVVLTAFAGPRPSPLHQPHYRNGNISDCSIDNLMWAVPGEPVPAPIVAPSPVVADDDVVEVSTVTSYRYGDVEVKVNASGKIELPEVTAENAAALAKLLERLGRGQ